MASEPLNDEVPPLQSQSQSAVALSGPEHVDMAQRYCLGDHYEQAMHHWNKALRSGYQFLHKDSKYLPLYIHSLMATNQKFEAFVVWNVLCEKNKLSTEPEWLKKYAQCTLDLSLYKQSLDLVALYTQSGGTIDEQILTICAQSNCILGNLKESVYYWEELLNTTDIEKIDSAHLTNAAQDFYSVANYKKATKCIGRLLEISHETSSSDLHLLAAHIFNCSDNYEKSIEQWKIFLTHPKSDIKPEHYCYVACTFYDLGEYAQARDFFNKYLTNTQDSEVFVVGLQRARHGSRFFVRRKTVSRPMLNNLATSVMLKFCFYGKYAPLKFKGAHRFSKTIYH